MTPHAFMLRTALACAALSLAALPAVAATTVNVVEDGEDGGPMSLKLKPRTVKAGEVTFNVKNNAVSEEHEMIVVRLNSADQPIPFNARTNRVDERKLNSLGEVEDIKPGGNGSLKANLKPGTYLLYCNIKGHYKAGMAGRLTVTP